MAELPRFDPRTLRAVPLFAALPDDDLHRLAGLVCRVRLPAGALLGDGSSTQQALIMVLDGQAKIFDDHAQVGGADAVLAAIGPGDHFGETLLLYEPPQAPVVIAATDIVFDQISGHDFRSLVAASPELMLPMLAVLGERLARVGEAGTTTQHVA
jgi:CRP-like cAMP-binding protein